MGRSLSSGITHKIHRVLGEKTVGYSTVETYVRMFALLMKETDTLIVLKSESDFSLDDRVALVLSDEPFLSVRQIAEKVLMSKSTMYRHLTETMRWKVATS
jgi:hypothetical protein